MHNFDSNNANDIFVVIFIGKIVDIFPFVVTYQLISGCMFR